MLFCMSRGVIPHAPILTQILNEASDIASHTAPRLTSGHVLFAMFTVDNSAQHLLRDYRIDEDLLLELAEGPLAEPPDTLPAIIERAEQVAGGCGAPEADCLHVLYAMTRTKGSSSLDLLTRTERPIAALRKRILAILTGAIPVWVADEEVVAREASARISHVRRGQKPSRRTVRSELFCFGVSAALDWSPPLVQPRRRKPSITASELEALRRQKVDRTVEPTPCDSTGPAELSAPPRAAPRRPSTPGPARKADPAEPWLLPSGEYPWLTSLGRNLSAEAARGGIDRPYGRDKEIETVIDILGRRRSNNPCLLGEPGVGKTAVVEGLACKLVDAPPTPALRDRIVINLDVGSLLIGTHLRGSFSEKLQGLREEVARAERVVIFFDELHTLVGAGSTGDGAQDAANELKAALARGEFPCIGATTTDEWRKHVKPDPALARRFYPVLVKEPTTDEAIHMIEHVVPMYAEHHGVDFAAESVRAAVELSARYIADRHLPDKAIALLDLAGSRAVRRGDATVDRDLIAALVAEQAEIPVERVLSSDRKRLLDLESHLSRYLVGHDKQLQRIADVVRRNAAGFGSHRPQGSFLFLGPTGVGKTEIAKVLAKILHGSEDALLRFDLSEFSEAHSTARLIGSPPGYVGYDEGGQMTEEMLRRPARVILLDEVEKAHRDVMLLFLQVLDEGQLSDGHGRSVSFSETIIIMTSNLGADLTRRSRPIGFGDTAPEPEDHDPDLEASIQQEVRARLAPELWSRFDERLVFHPLRDEEIREVARRMVAVSSQRLAKQRGIEYVLDDSAIDYLVTQGGYDDKLGARPLRQILSRIVEAPIAARILEGRLHADERVVVSTTPRGTLAFLVGDDSLSQRPTKAR